MHIYAPFQYIYIYCFFIFANTYIFSWCCSLLLWVLLFSILLMFSNTTFCFGMQFDYKIKWKESQQRSHNMSYKVFFLFICHCCCDSLLVLCAVPSPIFHSLIRSFSLRCISRVCVCVLCGHFTRSHCSVRPGFPFVFQWSCRMQKSSLQKHTHQVFYTRNVRPRILEPNYNAHCTPNPNAMQFYTHTHTHRNLAIPQHGTSNTNVGLHILWAATTQI